LDELVESTNMDHLHNELANHYEISEAIFATERQISELKEKLAQLRVILGGSRRRIESLNEAIKTERGPSNANDAAPDVPGADTGQDT